MKNVFPLILVLLASLAGCSSEDSSATEPPSLVGADKDKHGCIRSAGYLWCARTGECLRPWELAQKAGFANTPESFGDYCGE